MYTCTVTIVQDKTKTGNIKNYINVKLNLSDLLVYVINTNFSKQIHDVVPSMESGYFTA